MYKLSAIRKQINNIEKQLDEYSLENKLTIEYITASIELVKLKLLYEGIIK